jgi:hypothetical protein
MMKKSPIPGEPEKCARGEKECVSPGRLAECSGGVWGGGIYTDECKAKFDTACLTGQTKCEKAEYYTCENNQWIDNARIGGKCGMTCTTGETTCLIGRHLICEEYYWENVWYDYGPTPGYCGVTKSRGGSGLHQDCEVDNDCFTGYCQKFNGYSRCEPRKLAINYTACEDPEFSNNCQLCDCDSYLLQDFNPTAQVSYIGLLPFLATDWEIGAKIQIADEEFTIKCIDIAGGVGKCVSPHTATFDRVNLDRNPSATYPKGTEVIYLG